MSNTTFALKSRVIRSIYKPYKKILFLRDAEKVHNSFTNLGQKLGKKNFIKKITSALFNYENPMLEQEICGIKFKNPTGLAAGFDYESQLTQIIPAVGFGFHTIGSITLHSY